MKAMVLMIYLCMLLAACGSNGQKDSVSSVGAPSSAGGATSGVTIFANAGPDQSVMVNQTVQMDGSGSYGADGRPVTCAWRFLSKPAGSNASLSDEAAVIPSFTPDLSGYYQIELRAGNGTDSSATTVLVTVYPDSSQLFMTDATADKKSLNGYAQTGSVFDSSVGNISGRTFSLDRYELINSREVLVSTTDPAVLNNNLLDANVYIRITATLTASRIDRGFRSVYYFTDPTNGRKFIATVNYT